MAGSIFYLSGVRPMLSDPKTRVPGISWIQLQSRAEKAEQARFSRRDSHISSIDAPSSSKSSLPPS